MRAYPPILILASLFFMKNNLVNLLRGLTAQECRLSNIGFGLFN